MVKTESHRS